MKHLFDTKLKKGIAIAVAAVIAAGIITAVCIIVAHSRSMRAAESIHLESYRQLYLLKETSPGRKRKVNKIVDATHFYSENARVVQYERVKEGDKRGLVFDLEKTGLFQIQNKELRQQAVVLLTLIPKLDFVEYKIEGERYRRYQQYGENSEGKVFKEDGDETLLQHLQTGEAFAAFMEDLRPSYESQGIDEAVGKVLLAELGQNYSGGEFGAEGHTIMSIETSNNKKRAYAVTLYGTYRFINGNLIRIGGMEQTPAIFMFSVNDSGNYMFEHVDFARRDVDYDDAVKEMFLKDISATTLANHENIVEDLKAQEQKQAEKYLARLGRTGKAGTFEELPVTYLTRLGVPGSTADSILANEKLLSYPMWAGTQEFVEDGKR